MTSPRDLGYAILLAGHAAVGPRRLTELLDGIGPEAGWREVGGDPVEDPLRALERHVAAGITTLLRDDPR